MPDDLNERDIVRLARSVSHVEPNFDTARIALQAARREIEDHLHQQRRHRRRRWIIVTSSGIAAAIVLSLALLFVSTSPQNASAAERLQEAVEATDAYKGWVHIKAAGPKSVGQSMIHSNTVDGTDIRDTTTDGRRIIVMRRPGTREEIVYNSQRNEVVIGQMSEEFAKRWAKEIRNAPYTIKGMLELAKQAGLGEPMVSEAKSENGLDRFDIKMPEQKPSPDRVAGPQDLSAWIDTKTKLVQKIQLKFEQGPIEMNFTYGAPEIRDIYDAGAPRDAKVVDNRPKADADAILKRLEERMNKGFGPHVAVETQYSLDEQGKPESDGSLTLMAVSDDGDALSNQYLIGKTVGGKVKRERYDVAGWPTPTLADALKLKDASPAQFMVVIDRKSGWQGFEQRPGEYHVNTLTGKYTQMIPNLFAQFTAPGKTWPTRTGLGLFGAGSKVSIEPVKDHPQWIGLKIEQSTWTGQGPKDSPGSTQRSERLYVIDPTRDDMTISMSYTSYPPGGGEKPDMEVTQTCEPAQLASGAWYPATTTTRNVHRMPDGKENKYETIARLQIFPGEKLDAEWFKNYAEKKAK